MSNNINSKDFLIGALVGGIVGAVSALLFAPKSGKELRDDINEHAGNVKEHSVKLKDTAVERGGEWISVAKEKSSELAKTVSEQGNQIASKVKQIKGRFDESDTEEDVAESSAIPKDFASDEETEQEEVK